MAGFDAQQPVPAIGGEKSAFDDDDGNADFSDDDENDAPQMAGMGSS